MRERIYEIVERAEEGDTASSAYDIFIAIVAVISVSKLLVNAGGAGEALTIVVSMLDSVTVIVLFFDYVLRWITFDIKCEERGEKGPNGQPLGWIAFALYPFTLIAILEIIGLLPSFVPLPPALNYLILLRLLKVFRVLKGLSIIRKVFIREGRTLLSIFGIMMLYVVCVALIMYTYEPDTFSNFIDAIYWSTTALATIGYGDLYPHTEMGKFINIISALVGIAVVALPSGIITGGYVTEMRRQREKGVRSKRGIDAEYSLSESIEDRTLKTGKSIKKRAVTNYFKRNPKIVRYLVVMILCMFINIIFYALWVRGFLPVEFDTVGTMLAAFLLEPAAGVLVGFSGAIAYAYAYGSLVNVLYLLVDVLAAAVFGTFLSSLRGKLNVRRDLLIILALSVVTTAVNIGIWYLNGMNNDFSVRDIWMALDGLPFLIQIFCWVTVVYAGVLVIYLACYAATLLSRPVRRYLVRCEERDRERAIERQKEGEAKRAREEGQGHEEEAGVRIENDGESLKRDDGQKESDAVSEGKAESEKTDSSAQ